MCSIFVSLHGTLTLAGFLRSLEKYGKKVCHFPVWKSLDKTFYWFVSMEKENNFPDLIF